MLIEFISDFTQLILCSPHCFGRHNKKLNISLINPFALPVFYRMCGVELHNEEANKPTRSFNSDLNLE